MSIRFRLFDNGGRTCDRYTAAFEDRGEPVGHLLMSDNCNAANGVCMWADGGRYAEGEPIRFVSLPPPVQKRVRMERQALILGHYT